MAGLIHRPELAGAGVASAQHLLTRPYVWAAAAAVVLVALGGAWLAGAAWDGLTARRAGPAGRRPRTERRAQGMASAWERHRRLSARAARRRGRVTRPDLPRFGRAAVTEIGVRIGRAGLLRTPIVGSQEEFYLALAPPREGKTGWICSPVTDAPGPVVATSTRLDAVTHTVLARAARGPVRILNPDAVAGLSSTLRWSPLTGCETPAGAIERAGYLLDASPKAEGAENATIWEAQAHILLRLMLHAAALAGATMREVGRWVAYPPDPAPLDVLTRHPHAAAGWGSDLRDLRDAPAQTLASIARTASGALSWLADPAMEAAACPAPGEGLDVPEFLARRGTLYLIAADRPYTSAAPYIACLVAHLFEQAKLLAAARPGGRLSPPLTLALDEAAIICPVPLERWSAEAAGHGITVMAAVQSISQLHGRWGDNGARTIWNNATAKLIFGGFTSADDLEAISAICGSHDVIDTNPGPGSKKQRTYRSERNLPPERIRLLPKGRALLLYRTTRPVITRLTMVWDRRDYRPAPPAPPQPALPVPPPLPPRWPPFPPPGASGTLTWPPPGQPFPGHRIPARPHP